MALVQDILKGKTKPQMRWWATRWRRHVHSAPPSDTPLVVVCIPLMSRRRAEDWRVVERNLDRTLASLEAQSDPNWRAFICGQNRPDHVAFGPRVEWVPYRCSDKYYDKGDKRVALIRHIVKAVQGDGYYIQFDADDIAHPDLVAHLRRDNNGRGYLMETGYMADLAADRFAWLGPATETRATMPFYRMCGSSAAYRFDFRTQPALWRRLLARLSSHKRSVEWMRLVGLPLEPLTFPAGIYCVNHGENMIKRRGRNWKKVAYLDSFEITDAAARSEIRAAFGLDQLPPVA